jgi:hypothetical protein
MSIRAARRQPPGEAKGSAMSPLREGIGKHENELWKRLSEELGGRLTDEAGRRHDKVVAKVGPWAVTLDVHSEPGYRSEHFYTRLRGPFVNPDKLRFVVTHQTMWSYIGKMVGLQDIDVGHEPFDKMFRIQGNDEETIKALYADDFLRELVKAEPNIHIQVRDAGSWFEDYYPEDIDELVLEVEGEVKDLTRLKRLFSLFARVMNDLCRLGSAYEGE